MWKSLNITVLYVLRLKPGPIYQLNEYLIRSDSTVESVKTKLCADAFKRLVLGLKSTTMKCVEKKRFYWQNTSCILNGFGEIWKLHGRSHRSPHGENFCISLFEDKLQKCYLEKNIYKNEKCTQWLEVQQTEQSVRQNFTSSPLIEVLVKSLKCLGVLCISRPAAASIQQRTADTAALGSYSSRHTGSLLGRCVRAPSG